MKLGYICKNYLHQPSISTTTTTADRKRCALMGRNPGSCSKQVGLNRGAWTAQEDKILSDYVIFHGVGRWRTLPKKAGLERCGKSCRLRWLNYLRPDIKRGNISDEEEELIIRMHKLLGNRWSLIAGRLPGRTDNEIKNYWNTNLVKKLHPCPSPSPAASKKRSPRKKAKNPARKRQPAHGKPQISGATAMGSVDTMINPPGKMAGDTCLSSNDLKEALGESAKDAASQKNQTDENALKHDVYGGDAGDSGNILDPLESDLQIMLQGDLIVKEVDNINNENKVISSFNDGNNNLELEETNYVFNQTMLEEFLMGDLEAELDSQMEPLCIFMDSDIGWL